jgi:hypothetical protein
VNGRALAMLAAGFTLWAAAFVALYAMLSVGCRFGWDEIIITGGVSLQRAQLVGLYLASVAAGVALALALRRRAGLSFLWRAAYGAALAALAATVFSFAGVFGLSACI